MINLSNFFKGKEENKVMPIKKAPLTILEPNEKFDWREKLHEKTEIERIEMFNQALRDANMDWTDFSNKYGIRTETLFNVIMGKCNARYKCYQKIFSYMSAYKPTQNGCTYENIDLELRLNQIKQVYANLIQDLEDEMKRNKDTERHWYKMWYEMKAKYAPDDLHCFVKPELQKKLYQD